MPLYGFQGESNSPLRIIDVFKKLIELREECDEEIAAKIEQNILDIFQFIRD